MVPQTRFYRGSDVEYVKCPPVDSFELIRLAEAGPHSTAAGLKRETLVLMLILTFFPDNLQGQVERLQA